VLYGALVLLAIVAYFRFVGFDVVRSDPKHYLSWSHAFWVVETGTHFPMYPFVLWLFRSASFGLLQGAVLMQAVTLIAWIASVLVVGEILNLTSPASRRTGVALYALFPFVGVLYVAYPVGDALFGLLVVGAVFALLKRAWLPFAVCVGIGLISHKALWMPLGLLSIYAWRRLGYPLPNLLMSGLPLLGWYAWGYMHQSGLWMFKRHVDAHFTPTRLPVFDGLLSPIFSGGLKPLLKSALLLTITGAAGFITYVCARRKDYVWLCLTIPVLTMAMVLNTTVVWALVRFAKPIAIPLALTLFTVPAFAELLQKRAVHVALLIALGLTQVASAIYVEQLYFG
jgi:hypothetical protein